MNADIERIIKIEALLGELKSSLGGKSPQATDKPPGSKPVAFSGLTGEIYNLIQEGFFKEAKTISELQDKLRLEGIKKPTTTLMKPLLLLVRKRVLGRNKPDSGKGTFRYYQR